MQPATIDTATKKQFRKIGHKLHPVIIISSHGLSANILEDIDTRLEKNELIKIKIATGNRDAKRVIIDDICLKLHAQLVQQIGSIALLYRASEKPNAKLSNLLRIL